MQRATRHPALLWIASLAVLAAVYTVVSMRLERPDLLPPPGAIAGTFTALLTRAPALAIEDPEAHHQMHHSSEQVAALVREGVTLPQSLLITVGRVLFGLVVGVPLGILIGVLLSWSRRADDYLHPLYVLIRSVPPLSLITYIMLWLGHSEAHRLIPIVYAVAVTMVIPTYHGVRDVAAKYVVAARSLGARGKLLVRRVLLPAAGPAVLGGLRYAIAIACMTAVGAEMLMAENGMGNLIVGGGMWASRLQTQSDPAVVIVGVIALAAMGWAMDAAARAASARLTRWVR
jgi:ABC-type nitrate/sulfonate/bicarbonate transport system permease component